MKNGILVIYITIKYLKYDKYHLFYYMLKWYHDITYIQCALSHCKVCNNKRISEGLCFCTGQSFMGRMWRPTDKHDIFDL